MIHEIVERHSRPTLALLRDIQDNIEILSVITEKGTFVNTDIGTGSLLTIS